MSALPRVEGSPRRRETPKKWPVTPLPPSLAQPAPLMLLCPTCRTPRCATVDRIVIWHGEEREGKMYGCAGIGLPGLDWRPEAFE